MNRSAVFHHRDTEQWSSPLGRIWAYQQKKSKIFHATLVEVFPDPAYRVRSQLPRLGLPQRRLSNPSSFRCSRGDNDSLRQHENDAKFVSTLTTRQIFRGRYFIRRRELEYTFELSPTFPHFPTFDTCMLSLPKLTRNYAALIEHWNNISHQNKVTESWFDLPSTLSDVTKSALQILRKKRNFDFDPLTFLVGRNLKKIPF